MYLTYLFQVAKKNTPKENESSWFILKKNIKDTFEYEDKLQIFYYNPYCPTTKDCKKWNFSELRFSLYQEAFEYVKDLQKQDNEFDANIAKLRDYNRMQYTDLISTFKRTKSEQVGHADIQNLEKKMENLQNDLMIIKNDIKAIKLLCEKVNDQNK